MTVSANGRWNIKKTIEDGELVRLELTPRDDIPLVFDESFEDYDGDPCL